MPKLTGVTRVLVAIDKFKGALSADVAGTIVRRELRTLHPTLGVDLCPLTDGGEGFVTILTGALAGKFTALPVTGPRGAPLDASIGWVRIRDLPTDARALLALPENSRTSAADAQLAVIEMASATGLASLAAVERDPWLTTSRGTGRLIRAAADHGAAAILLGIGGSATNDLGTGALAELGLQFLDDASHPVFPPVPAAWPRVQKLHGRIDGIPPIRIACDVTNPLLGPTGTTAVYGPQKGLKPGDVGRLENEVRRMASLIRAHHPAAPDATMSPGAGAAGGIAFGFATGLGAQLVNGFELTRRWCRLDERIAAADLVVTGEGCFDETSLQGKGPGAIAALARARGKEVHVFAGFFRIAPPADIFAHAITPPGTPLADALAAAPANLAATVRHAFADSPGR